MVAPGIFPVDLHPGIDRFHAMVYLFLLSRDQHPLQQARHTQL